MSVLTATKWAVDASHSTAAFKVRHLGVANVTGNFKVFQGEIEHEGEDFDGAKIHFVVDTNSLDTNHAQRDGHLKSADFLHTEQFPAMIFDGVLRLSGGGYKVEGDLTIRDVTKAVTFDAELTGMGKGRFGDNRAGFEVDGRVNRKDFGLTWSMLTESGGLIVGEEVKMHFDVELIREG
jgi:polyisoprenoid-binding protein YceI